MSCLDDATLARFVAGDVASAERATLEDHLDRCDDCRTLLAAAARAADAGVNGAPSDALAPTHVDGLGGAGAAGAVLLPGELVGRYRIEECLGAGGMGTVYAAFDPELGRRIAIKVLRAEAFGRAGVDEGQQRLRREAQALASLSHPNIVAIHDVGTHDAQVFIAMELVEGAPMSRWLREQARTWREVRAVFLEAGRGLAAAHAAGLVHRDFKPDNVLVGNDGRVRVTDFGLARAVGAAASEGSSPSAARAPVSTHAELTRAGTVLGTPAYMAPEQHRGAATDARSDQFGFCVALFEALFRLRPFRADDSDELAKVVQRGEVVPLPKEARVPAWLARIALRGLRPDPGDRYPSMEALLVALAYDPVATRRRIVLASAALVTGGVVVALSWALASQDPDPCEGTRSRLGAIWDPPRRLAAERAFAATGKPYAAQAWQGAAAALDAYAERWVAARRRACVARRGVAGGDSTARSAECLDGRLAELRAVGDAFTRADARTVERALATVHGMSSLGSCEDPSRLPHPEPEDETTRAEVAKVRAALARARVAYDAGRYDETRSGARAALAAAQALAYAPMVAEAFYLLGQAEHRLGRTADAEVSFEEALLAAESSRHEEVSARARVSRVWIANARSGRLAEAERLARQALAGLRRIGGDSDIEAELSLALSSAYSTARRIPEALAQGERALALRERLYGADHPTVATSLQTLAITHAREGRFSEALPLFQRALTIRERALGGRHPLVGMGLANLGILFRRMGRLDESADALRRAIVISREALGADAPALASDLHNLGNTLLDRSDVEPGLAAFREALAIRRRVLPAGDALIGQSQSGVANALLVLGRTEEAVALHREVVGSQEKHFGADHAEVAMALTNLGRAETAARQPAAARATLGRALALQEKRGRDHPRVADVLIPLGELLLAEREPKAAIVAFERALDILRRAHGEEHFRAAQVLVQLGEAQLDAGGVDSALSLADRALSILARVPGPPPTPAAARFLRARAAWAKGRSGPEALAAVRDARAALAGAGTAARLQARIREWLTRRER